MKRNITALFMSVCFLFSAVSCGVETEQSSSVSSQGSSVYADSSSKNDFNPAAVVTSPKAEEAVESTDTEDTSQILVTYFSCTNTTKILAEYSSAILGADLYELTPEIPYTEEDIAYYTDCRADQEQSDPSARPAISGGVENMADYDTVVIGYPIWHGQAPRIISTFLESYDFSGKTIVPFCTSHSSGIGTSDDNLHELAENAVWLEGKRFSADTTKEDMQTWFDSIGVHKSESPVITYTIADIRNLQDFLLARPTEEDLSGKPYDLNNDNRWDAFDLCLMKRAFMQQHHLVGEFDFDLQTVLLRDGYTMPIVGLGTYSLLDDTCVESVYEAIKRGYRLIDTAYMYHNEAEVGKGVRKAIDEGLVTREEMFITTKLYPNQFSDPEAAIEEALQKLDLDYIDLMLLHHPGDDDVKAYKAIEKYIESGKIRSVGLSNYYIEEIDDFVAQVNIPPVLVQNEIHPYYQEQEVIPYMQAQDIVVEAWYPLGGRGHQKELLNDETLVKIAEAHNKSVAQVILRWDLQNGVVVIPGSSNPDHMQENISIFDFELTDDEMAEIAALERNEKHDWY